MPEMETSEEEISQAAHQQEQVNIQSKQRNIDGIHDPKHVYGLRTNLQLDPTATVVIICTNEVTQHASRVNTDYLWVRINRYSEFSTRVQPAVNPRMSREADWGASKAHHKALQKGQALVLLVRCSSKGCEIKRCQL